MSSLGGWSGRIVTWHDAEFASAAWMRDNGWPTARVTGGSADSGIDIDAGDVVAQVKWHSKPVGRPDLQRLMGAVLSRGGYGLMFSGSGFTKPAIEYAQEQCIGLYNLDRIGAVSPLLDLRINDVSLGATELSRVENEDPAVRDLDFKIHRLNVAAARVTDTIAHRSRQKLGFRSRSRLEKARRLVASTSDDIATLQNLYDRGKWRAANRRVDRILKTVSQAGALMRQ